MGARNIFGVYCTPVWLYWLHCDQTAQGVWERLGASAVDGRMMAVAGSRICVGWFGTWLKAKHAWVGLAACNTSGCWQVLRVPRWAWEECGRRVCTLL